jgi:hypothetical protein
MMMVVAHAIFEAGWRSRRLNAPEHAFRDQNTEGVVDRLKRDRTDLCPHRCRYRVGGDMRLTRDRS